MLKAFKQLSLLSTLLIVACASTPKVHSLYDREADFSQYKTYGFIDSLKASEGQYSTLVTKYLKKAISRELEARGYRFSNKPDLLVNFKVVSKDKLDIFTTPHHTPRYYGYRRGYYSPWPYYSYETRVREYTEGTLNIDLVDAKQMQLVWEGIAVGRVPKNIIETLETHLNEVVALIFKEKFNLKAGKDMDKATPL